MAIKRYNVAVVGATGAVGTEMIRMLQERRFPVGRLRLLASARSAGKRLRAFGGSVAVEALTTGAFDGVDIALFSAGKGRSLAFAPAAVERGAVVIDNSSAYRMDPNVPLVIPEINPEDLRWHRGIIANPNCSTIIMLVPLWPLHKAARIRRIIVATYQSASGAGAKAMAELEEQTRQVLTKRPVTKEVFPHQYAFNLFSHNSAVDAASGYNEEELKMVLETRKIFHDRAIRVTPTCVRVPVLRAHSEAITIECDRALSPARARRLLAKAPGVRVIDDRQRNYFPMPLEASGRGDVLVGRIRKDLSHPRGLCLFVSGDQLLKGAALNAVQIAELLIRGRRHAARRAGRRVPAGRS